MRIGEENRRAIKLAEDLMSPDTRTPEEDALLDLLSGLIDTFERAAFPWTKLAPLERLLGLL